MSVVRSDSPMLPTVGVMDAVAADLVIAIASPSSASP
jgi:hypothetical protein